MSPPPCLYDTVIQSYVQYKIPMQFTIVGETHVFHGTAFAIVSQWGNFGGLLSPSGATFTPWWGMFLQSLPASSNVVNYKFLRNHWSVLRVVKVCGNVKSMGFFLPNYLPLGRTPYPPSLRKVTAHLSSIIRTIWRLNQGSVMSACIF